MVSFRLSATEYAEVEGICRAHGYRSVSLFARCAILASVARNDQQDAYESRINNLTERVETMAAELIRISAHVRHSSETACPVCAAEKTQPQQAARADAR